MNPQDYQEAMAVQTVTEARMWMAARIREFLKHWQREGMGREEARRLICINLAYNAGKLGAKEQERVYQLYGALHPLVLCMTKEQRKGRQFLHEFTQEEIRQASDLLIQQAIGSRTLPEGAPA
jgi:hypothetical protein